MDLFLKITACVLVSVILALVLEKQGKDYSLLLCLAVCTIVCICTLSYIEPIMSFLHRLVQIGDLQESYLSILLKTVGISFISQIAVMICEDGGNKSLGKSLQLLTAVVLLWIILPLLEEMVTLMESVLEAI